MMASEMTTRQGRATSTTAPLPRKRFRFLFGLGSDYDFCDGHECEAPDEHGAFAELERRIPGASIHVKSVRELH